MGCIESLGWSLSPSGSVFRVVVPPYLQLRFGGSGAKRRKGVARHRRRHRRSFFPFSLSLHPRTSCRVSFDGWDLLSLFFSLSSSRHKGEAISASHTHSGHVSRSICHSLVSRVHGRREEEEGVFIRRNETRLPSAVFVCFSCRTARVNVDSMSFDAGFNRERLVVLMSIRTWLLPRCYTNWNDMISRNAVEHNEKLRCTTKFVSVPCGIDAIPVNFKSALYIGRLWKKYYEGPKLHYFRWKM